MNKSFSKLRHIQESNRILETRRLLIKEQQQTTYDASKYIPFVDANVAVGVSQPAHIRLGKPNTETFMMNCVILWDGKRGYAYGMMFTTKIEGEQGFNVANQEKTAVKRFVTITLDDGGQFVNLSKYNSFSGDVIANDVLNGTITSSTSDIVSFINKTGDANLAKTTYKDKTSLMNIAKTPTQKGNMDKVASIFNLK